MPVYPCARGCPRLVSISQVAGGNAVALADPEGYAVHYVACTACGAHVCDRCARIPPAPPCMCPRCGTVMVWGGPPAASPALPRTQVMQGSPLMASPTVSQANAGPWQTPVATAAPVAIPWTSAWFSSGGTRYERTAPPATLHAELPGIEALHRERDKVGGYFGWGALLALIGILPSVMLTHEVLSRDLSWPIGAVFASSFVICLTLWFFITPSEMALSRFGEVESLLAKLQFAPGTDVKLVVFGATDCRWLELDGTLISGVRLRVTRTQSRAFVSRTQTGRTIRTTFSITADDEVMLRFDEGRVPLAQLEAAATLLRQTLGAAAGGRLVVRALPTELALRFPAAVQPSIEPVSESLPRLVSMLHGLLGPGPAVAVPDAARPPRSALPAAPANGGIAGALAHPVALATSAVLVLVALLGVTVGGASIIYHRVLRDRLSDLYERQRDAGYGGYGWAGSPESDLDREVVSARSQDEVAEVASYVCTGPGFAFGALGPAMLGMGASTLLRRRQQR